MDKAMEMKDEEIKELRDNLEAVSKEKMIMKKESLNCKIQLKYYR